MIPTVGTFSLESQKFLNFISSFSNHKMHSSIFLQWSGCSAHHAQSSHPIPSTAARPLPIASVLTSNWDDNEDQASSFTESMFNSAMAMVYQLTSTPLFSDLAASEKRMKNDEKSWFLRTSRILKSKLLQKKTCLSFSKPLHREVDPSMWMALMTIHSQQQHRASIQQHLTVASRHRPQAEAHGSGIHLAGVSSSWVWQWDIPRKCIWCLLKINSQQNLHLLYRYLLIFKKYSKWL